MFGVQIHVSQFSVEPVEVEPGELLELSEVRERPLEAVERQIQPRERRLRPDRLGNLNRQGVG